MLRNVSLMALLMMGVSVFASDKPAVQARERMEADARGQTSYTAAEEHYVSNGRHVRNDEDRVAVDRDANPVANVGYQRRGPIVENRVYVHDESSWNNDSSTKPSVQARLRMEQGR